MGDTALLDRPARTAFGAPHVAVVGADGAAGGELLHWLEARNVPLAQLRLLASAPAGRQRLRFRGEALPVEKLGTESFAGIDLALFAAGAAISRDFVPAARHVGAVVVDNSPAFRADPAVTLGFPGIDTAVLAAHRGIVASPSCTALVALAPLWPLHLRFGIRRLSITACRIASGGGGGPLHEVPAAGAGSPTEKEMALAAEMRRILDDAAMRVSATCIRTPMPGTHIVSLSARCARRVTAEEVRDLLAGSGTDGIRVGRIRRDSSDPDGRSIAMLATSDQAPRLAALNVVRIVEMLSG